MSRELFLCDRKGAIVEVPRDYSSEAWGAAQRAYAKLCGKRDLNLAYVSCHTLYEDQCKFGVYYSWGLAGPDGAWFEIYRFPEADPADVKKCRSQIYHESDVVRLTTYTIKQWMDFALPTTETQHEENTETRPRGHG